MRKRILAVLTLVFLAIAIVSCGQKEVDEGKEPTKEQTTPPVVTEEPPIEEEPEETEENILTIGALTSDQNLPFVTIQELKLDEERDFQLQIIYYESIQARDQAMQEGMIDGAISDYVSICSYQEKGFRVKTIGCADGEYLLLTAKNSGISSIDQCKGERVAVLINTVAEYALDYIVAQSNYRDDFLQKVNAVSYDECKKMLTDQRVKLCIIPKTCVEDIIDDVVVLGSSTQERLYPNVVCIRQEVISENEQMVSSYIDAYNSAVAYLNMKGESDMEFRDNQLPTDEELEDAIMWAAKKNLCKETIRREELVYDATEKAQ